MKKHLFIIAAVLLLPACADKNEYKEAVLADIKKEKDLDDYNITPEYMADCVVQLSSQNMPGFFDLDPQRMTAYRNYTKMLTMMKAADPKKAMEELRTQFGSPKALADAHANYTESMLECYTSVVSKSEGERPDSSHADETLPEDEADDDLAGMDAAEEEGGATEGTAVMEEGQEALEENQRPEEE